MRRRYSWVLVAVAAAVLLFLQFHAKYPGFSERRDHPWHWARHTMIEISGAILDYHRDHGRVPATLGDLLKSRGDEETTFLDTLLDPWGRPYHYRALPGGLQFEFRSGGPDRTLWTEDDIVKD